MNKIILDYINKCEGWKTAIKGLHWDADSLEQHELCDDIAERIADFQDQVSEVEQSKSGKLSRNAIKGTRYKVSSLKAFVEDVLADTKVFYKKLTGDAYIGMRSDCESFLSDMERKLYLVNFTMKESLRMRLRALNESRPKNPSKNDEIDKLMGKKPTLLKTRIKQIEKMVKKYGIESRTYSDNEYQVFEDYEKVIKSLGGIMSYWKIDNGYNENFEDHYEYESDMEPEVKEYKCVIEYDDGMKIVGNIDLMPAGTMGEPFSSFKSCMYLRKQEAPVLGESYQLKACDIKRIIKEVKKKI